MTNILCIAPDVDALRNVEEGFEAHECTLQRCDDIESGQAALSKSGCDIVILWTEVTTEAQEHCKALRRAARRYIYILLVSESWPPEAALELGANDVIAPQIESDVAGDVLAKIGRLFSAMDEIGDQRQDFPSVGGVISRSAFYQLFLTAMDRASRHGERSYLLLISLDNYQELYDIGGDYVADYAIALMSRKLAGMRRQSDILGHISRSSYALLMQRPNYDTEPLEAAQRFASTLSEAYGIAEGAPVALRISVNLVDIPSGHLSHETILTLERAKN